MSVAFKLSHIKHRRYFANLLNTRHAIDATRTNLLRSAVEIGTHRGEFAEMLLKAWAGHGILHCVDPWISGEKGVFDQPDAWGDRNADYEECLRRLQQWIAVGRVVIMKATSSEAATSFRNGSLDFVYIDGNHRRPHVDEDLWLWWPKVRVGGVFAGHDLTGIWEPEVRPAVEEWAEREGIAEIKVVLGDRWRGHVWGDCASWYVERVAAAGA